MKRIGLIGVLLCIAVVTVCIAGCSAFADNDKADKEARASDDAEDNAKIAKDIGAYERIVAGDVDNKKDSAKEEIVNEESLCLSIFGDSISTYTGYIPEECSIFYPENGGLTDVSQTWWMKFLEDTGMELCSNDSSSGSTCVGDSLSVDNPRYGCSDYRVSLLVGEMGKTPDIIIVYMGTNDVLESVPIGDNDGTKLVEEGLIEYFSDAYSLMLDKIASAYPAAQIYCCSLLPIGTWGTAEQPIVTNTHGRGLTSEDYSARIRVIAHNKGIPVIDLRYCGIEIDNLPEMTSDGVHPISDGMELIERAMLDGINDIE